MNIYSVIDVFTPNKPARATFIERDLINNKLVDALRTPGKQVVVYGHSGCGKTTLLVNKLEQLFEGYIVSRCTKDSKFEQLMLQAFDQLGKFYLSERSDRQQSEYSASFSSDYKLIKSVIGGRESEESVQKHQRIVSPQLTPQNLAKFLGQAKHCWVLEDFHKIEPSEKTKLAQSMKLFMDMADEFPDMKIIVIGAVATARQVIEYEPEMRNRVAEINVPLMSSTEIMEIINKGEQLLDISFGRDTKNGILKYSNGLAGICHQLCLNICNYMNINVTVSAHVNIHSPNTLEKALEKYLEEASDTLKSSFDKALRVTKKANFQNCQLILQALIEHGEEGATSGEIFQTIRKKTPKYPQGNLQTYLTQLMNSDRGSLLRYDNSSGKYSFVDPIYRFFAMVILKDRPQVNDVNLKHAEFKQLSLPEFLKIQEEVLKRMLEED